MMRQIASIGISLSILLACAGCQPGSSNPTNDAEQSVLRGHLRFSKDTAAGLMLAKQQSRPCLLFFTADWCTLCQQMESAAFVDPTIKKLAQNFVCVLVDADQEPEVCRRYEISGYPTIQFLDIDGRRLHRLVGQQPTSKLAAGMHAAIERLAWLEKSQRSL